MNVAAPRLPAIPVRLPDLSHHAFNVWRRNQTVYGKRWRTELFLPLLEPLLVLLGLGLGLGKFIQLNNGISYLRFLAPGVLAEFGMFQAVFECGFGSYFRMENQGTFTAIAATPASLDDVVAGELLWAATRALINCLYILVVLLAFTPSYAIVRSPWAIVIIPVTYLLGLCFAGLSLAFTALAPSISFLTYYFTIVIIPLFWLSGTFFPLERMPLWLQGIAWALPLTEATAVYRHLLNGNVGFSDLLHIVIIAAEAALFGSIAAALVRRRLIK